MKLYDLVCEQEVSRPLEEVFEFFSRPENLTTLTPATMEFEILTPPPLVMEEGALIEYSLRVMGVPTRWRTLIESYEPPHQFVDVQLKGPYKHWRHTHSFESTEQGTLIRDAVQYAVPFGPLGWLAHEMIIRKQLLWIFSFREDAIKEIFPAAE